MNRVAVVSPGYPDSAGGVTDHAARLVRSWTDLGTTVRVIGDVSGPIELLVNTFQSDGIEAVLIQYVPFLYGRRGLSRVPERIAKDCQTRGIGVTTFVHEPWVPPTRLPWLVLSPLQKRQLKRIVIHSDVVVTAVPTWAAMLGHDVRTLYVGSNIGEASEKAKLDPAIASPVVFSPFAAGLKWDWIAAATKEIGVGLTVIGSDYDTATRHASVRNFADAEWDWLGRLPAEEVLEVLVRARLVLAPFMDGITGRRGSAMAAMSAGSRLLSSTGNLYDPSFSDGPVAVADSKNEFVRSAVHLWNVEDAHSGRLRRLLWFRENCAAAKLDERLLSIVTARPGS